MKRTSLVASSAVVCALLLTATPSEAQLPRDPAERARVIAEIMETQTRTLTLFDRQGNQVGLVGSRDPHHVVDGLRRTDLPAEHEGKIGRQLDARGGTEMAGEENLRP